jgi:hypothetical protein
MFSERPDSKLDLLVPETRPPRAPIWFHGVISLARLLISQCTDHFQFHTLRFARCPEGNSSYFSNKLCRNLGFSVIVGSDPRSLAVGESKWDAKRYLKPFIVYYNNVIK